MICDHDFREQMALFRKFGVSALRSSSSQYISRPIRLSLVCPDSLFDKIFSFSVTKHNSYKDELTAKQVANDNPFDTYVLKPEAGKGLLKSQPILVPSMKKSRYVRQELEITM